MLPKVGDALRTELENRLLHATSTRDFQTIRDTLHDLSGLDRAWMDGVRAALLQRLKPGNAPHQFQHSVPGRLELLATEVVEDELLASKLALSVQEASGQEWADLKLRLVHADGRSELATSEVTRPESVARVLVDEWIHAGLSRESWKQLAGTLHSNISQLLAEAYRDANRFLIANGVMPEIHPKHVVRKAPSSPSGSAGAGNPGAGLGTGQPPLGGGTVIPSRPGAQPNPGSAFEATAHLGSAVQQTGSEMGSGIQWWNRMRQQTQDVLARINHLMGDRTTAKGANSGESSTSSGPPTPSPRLQAMLAVSRAREDAMADAMLSTGGELADGSPAQMERVVQRVRRRSAALKQATDSPGEKATIEVVALMFQSILSEDRIQPTMRVWFARLQIPVLRVALAEPDFFSSLQHPARRLIDRMGSCALGFDANLADVSTQALEVEIRRIVQVIEQYPETGRRVFQLAFDEFQKFLATHLRASGQAERLVTVAQQVEQKETLAVQYTIELRKQLNDMPVRDNVRDFLFKVWAEVLAVATVKFGHKHDMMTELKQTASDLLWAASAKPTRNERAQVIAQLPRLLTRLRKGMTLLGMDADTQEVQIKTISDILADAFMSRTETIPPAQLEAVTRNLSRLEDFLPQEEGLADLELDQDSIELITGVDASNIEVITQGGKPPGEAMRAWAMELQLGSWFRLDHNNNPSQVQLAWRSNRGQLCLFTSPSQRCYLIQTARVASYLQAGLLIPAEDESLTVRATRAALEKLDANPERLLA